MIRAIIHYFAGLLAGDPVAWTFTGIVVFLALILLLVVFFIGRAQHREDKELEKRRRRGY